MKNASFYPQPILVGKTSLNSKVYLYLDNSPNKTHYFSFHNINAGGELCKLPIDTGEETYKKASEDKQTAIELCWQYLNENI